MSRQVVAEVAGVGRVALAVIDPAEYGAGMARCTQCPCVLQRSSKGDLLAGVRAHYRTVHPEVRI